MFARRGHRPAWDASEARGISYDATFLAVSSSTFGSRMRAYDIFHRYVRVFVRIRPHGPLSYEHMFPRSTPPTRTRRARNALSLARSFLLLEDDYDVDWEVDQDEPGRGETHQRRGATGGNDELGMRDILSKPTAEFHPHRASLRGRSARKRAGQSMPAPQVCLCPRSRTGTAKPAPKRTGRPQAARM
jgi:hypothetical protein